MDLSNEYNFTLEGEIHNTDLSFPTAVENTDKPVKLPQFDRNPSRDGFTG